MNDRNRSILKVIAIFVRHVAKGTALDLVAQIYTELEEGQHTGSGTEIDSVNAINYGISLCWPKIPSFFLKKYCDAYHHNGTTYIQCLLLH